MKVLIVEDDLITADMAEEALVEQGYEVCGIARTVDEGLELSRRHQPDLAVVDQRLANDGRGTDLVARLVGFSQIGVLYASGNVANVILNATAGHACLTKPYRPIDLLRRSANLRGGFKCSVFQNMPISRERERPHHRGGLWLG